MVSSFWSPIWTNLFLGLCTLMGGLFGIGIFQVINKTIQFVQISLAVGILILSVVSIFRPLAGDGILSILFVVAAAYPIMSGLLLIFQGISFPVLLVFGVIVIGISMFQLYWARRYFIRNRHFIRSGIRKPKNESLLDYLALWAVIDESFKIGTSDKDEIELTLDHQKWRGFLLQNRLIIISCNKKLLLITEGTDIELIPRYNKIIKPNSFNGIFQYDLEAIPITIDPRYFMQFARWKPEILEAETGA